MKRIISVLCISLFFVGCASQKEDKTTDANETSEQADVLKTNEEGWSIHGTEISVDEAVSASELPALLEGKDSVYVKLNSEIEACCQNSGCWMDVKLGEGKTMKVTFKDYGFFIPQESAGKKTYFEGWAFRKTYSVDELRHYAGDNGKSQEEIDAITEPKTEISFVADGVLIK